MNCDTCQALLMDLALGELSAERSRDAHVHVGECEQCRNDLRVLSEGLSWAEQLPLETPPPSVRAQVLEAARRKLQDAEAQRRVALASDGADHEGWWARLLSQIGGLATSPQVAMATLLMLVGSVGYYYLPAADEAPLAEAVVPAAAPAEATPATDPAAAATAVPIQVPQLAPMPPPSRQSDEAKDSDQERGQDMKVRRPARRRSKPSPYPGYPSKQQEARAEPAQVPSYAKKKSKATPSKPTFAPPPAQAPTGLAGLAGPSANGSPGSNSSGSGRAAGQSDAKEEEAFAERELADDAPEADAARFAAPPANAAELLVGAQAALSERKYADAARLAETALSGGKVDAPLAHWIAGRAHKAAGKCRLALPHYSAVRRTPKRFPRALIDGATCLQQIGRNEQADQWLAQAEAIPSLRAEATRLRARSNAKRSAPPSASSSEQISQ